VFVVSACLLLAGSIVVARQQDRDLSGIHGIPVEGHDIVAGVEIVGTKQLDLSRSGWHKLDERLRAVVLSFGRGGLSRIKRCVASRRSCET